MKHTAWLILLVPTLCFASDYPLEEYLDVSSLTRRPQSHVGKSVSVIDSTIIEEYKPLSLTDTLHNVPGVYVKRVNGLSGLTNVRIRDSRSIDTKLLYNGMPLQDPSDPQGSSNPLWGDLLASGIEKVEILSGASSSTWGSKAIGGVINVVPKKGSKEEVGISGEYGTYNTFTESIEASNRWAYASLSHLDSEGFDASDSYEHTTGNLNLMFSPSSQFSSEVSLLASNTQARLNDSPVIIGGVLQEDIDDANDKREYSLLHGGMVNTLHVTNNIVVKNKVGLTDSDRRFLFLPDSEFDWYSDGTYYGNDFILSNQVTLTHTDNLSTTLGHQYERQWYELETLGESDQADAYANDYYLEEAVDLDNLHLQLAIRENTHERTKEKLTYDISGVWSIDRLGTNIRAHMGTGFRTPSLYELFGAFLTDFGRFEVGNPLLSPERARSYAVGFDTRTSDNLSTFGTTAFRNEVENKIDFVSFSYANVDGKDSSQGIELFFERYIIDGLSFRTSYTYTEGDNLVDVPESLWDASLRYAKDKWVANVRTRYVSDHKILAFNLDDFTVDKVNEEGYYTVDITVSYKVKPNIELYMRGENILSSDYHVGGYRTPGTRVYGGVTWSF
mgnify:CR=1 FL=1